MVRENRVITFADESFEAPAPDDNARRLDALANQIRSLYCICFREVSDSPNYGRSHMLEWDGDPEGRSGKRTVPIWPKIAAAIVRCNADPFLFVRAQFYAVKTPKPPAPNTFISDKAVARWELFREHAKKNLVQLIESDDNQIQVNVLPFTLNLNWPYVKALDYALRNPACEASALTRYCYAVAAGLPVAAKFHDGAILQYMFQMSDYDGILGNRIPPQLKEETKECRRRLVGRD